VAWTLGASSFCCTARRPVVLRDNNTNIALRLKLSGHLSERGLSPHIYESHQEALDWLTTTKNGTDPALI
jgi:hypothetical protein